MNLENKAIDKLKTFFRGIPVLYLYLLGISPILISLLIHIGTLYYANRVTWNFGARNDSSENAATTVVIDGSGRKDDRLRFQGIDQLDSFEADENKSYPTPEIEYRPVMPEVEIFPDSSPSDEPGIISVDSSAANSEWVNPSTGGQPLYTGPEMLAGSFSRHLQMLREGGLDVVFVFDSTSSMAPCIREIKFKISNLTSAFRKLVPECRIGLVTYRDLKDDYVTKMSPLTYGMAYLRKFLLDTEAEGGYDDPEAVKEGLEVAVDEMKWNIKSKKFILLIGDAPPHKEDMPEAIEIVKRFRNKMGGALSALDTRALKKISMEYWKFMVRSQSYDPDLDSFDQLTDSQAVMDDFQILAEIGGGECARLINEEKVVKNMLLLIFGSRWEMYIDGFMKEL